MIFAADGEQRVRAWPSGRASCPSCQAMVIAKCGQIVSWHWAHEAIADCDPWAEPDSSWHLSWQETVPEDRREVVMGPHRADMVAPDGMVVELQHSSISVAEIAAREQFYGRMVWLFDAVEAADEDRLDIRWRSYRGRPAGARTGVSFRWKHPRKSVAWCAAPVLLDLGDQGVLRMMKFYGDSAPYGGWGWLFPAEWIRSWLSGPGSQIPRVSERG